MVRALPLFVRKEHLFVRNLSYGSTEGELVAHLEGAAGPDSVAVKNSFVLRVTRSARHVAHDSHSATSRPHNTRGARSPPHAPSCHTCSNAMAHPHACHAHMRHGPAPSSHTAAHRRVTTIDMRLRIRQAGPRSGVGAVRGDCQPFTHDRRELLSDACRALADIMPSARLAQSVHVVLVTNLPPKVACHVKLG